MSKANRKTNRSKRTSHSCRNNGSCNWCSRGRTFESRKKEYFAQEQIKEALDPEGFIDSDAEEHHIVSEKLHDAHNRNILEHILNKKIDDLIDEWEESNSPLDLWEFMGWTEKEYKDWFEKGRIPVAFINKLFI